MELEEFSVELYHNIGESRLAIAGFGDLLLKVTDKSEKVNGELSSLTDKLNEYGSKYLKMVTDVYNGLTNLRKGFIVGNEITYPGGKKSESFYVDTFPKKLDEVPFIIELGK